MNEAKLSDVTWLYSDELSIHIGVHDSLPNNAEADIVYAKLTPGATLPLHTHARPTPDGYEAFFFYRGADMMLLLPGEERHISTDEPFHLTFVGDEIHGIKNISSTDLIFEVICAPRHVDGEETVVQSENR